MHEVDWSLWTDWTAFDALDWSLVPTGPGAYLIAAGQPINRAIGADPDGYLDVGESGNLTNRLWSFRRCATQRGCTGHMAGWRYAFFHFDRQFPFASLRVRWRAAATKQEAYAAEGQVLLGYLRRYCELPPLNYKFNWQVFEEHGWDILDRDAAVDADSDASPERPRE
ncbi:MAG TPA: hypothetical protein VFE78_36530 [Gemmataceae bacterium]|nr:hypothetical protein [Gemmataceae bacterium]